MSAQTEEQDIQYAPDEPTNAEAEGMGGQTHRSGIGLLQRALSDLTTPSETADEIQRAWLVLERIWTQLMPLRAEYVSGLSIGINAGYYRKSDNTAVYFAGSAAFALDDDTAGQKVWIATGTNTLAKGTSWPGDVTTFIPICEADTASGAVTAKTLVDRTQLMRHWLNATGSSPTGTTATSFLIDDDNAAGAGADVSVDFERGTDDSEDAAVQWDAANARFNLLARKASAIAAALNVDELRIDGTVVLDVAGTLKAAAIDAARLYVFGANGSTPAGVQLTPAGSAGAPASGTHALGELHLDSANILWQCTTAGTPGTWKQFAVMTSTLVDKLIQVSIGDATGGSPQDVVIQLKDRDGVNLAEQHNVVIGVYDDAWAADEATNATLSSSPSVGSFRRWLSTNKVAIYTTDASGALTIAVTDASTETVYVLSEPGPRSPTLDCRDIGTLAFA